MSNGFEVSKKMENSNFPPIQHNGSRHDCEPKIDRASPETLSGIGEVLWKVRLVLFLL